MNCKNHPDKAAVGTSAGCGADFCEECLSKFKEKQYCAPCMKAEATLATADLKGGTVELAHMKKSLIGCSAVLLALVLIPMVLLIYPCLKLGDVSRCRQSLRRIYAALETYARQNDGLFPPDNNDLRPLFAENLLQDREVFECPGAKEMALGIEDMRGSTGYLETYPPTSSYLYKGGLRLPEGKESPRALLWDKSPRNHRGRGINVLYTNGDVKFETKNLSRFKLRKLVGDQ